MIKDILDAIDSRRNEALNSLKEFLAIPSVSTKPEHTPDMRKCAEWLAGRMGKAGLSARVEESAGHPVVLAKNEHKAGRPTVLFYGHYDVQPPEPLEQWISPPFSPTVRKDENGFDAVFARGAVDDKGQVWAHVEAIRAWNEQGGQGKQGGLPVNIIMLVEGEEEIGSPNLGAFIEKHKNELRGDLAVISDTDQFARGIPAITSALRGLVYMEVTITGPSHDLHSGQYGGSVPNPANVLCELLATLHDKDGRVNISGFYDDVADLSREDREEWKRLGQDDAKVMAELKLTGLCGEKGYSTLERQWGRPTCDINGLTSGYQGHGAKTIIPSKASAKVSMRLVANQDPVKVRAAFERTLAERCPKEAKIEFAAHGIGGPILVKREGKAMECAVRAVEAGFGKKPVLTRSGGSIPVVAQIKSMLGMDTLLVGFGLPDDRVHSPNEKFDLEAFWRGMRTAAALYGELGAMM